MLAHQADVHTSHWDNIVHYDIRQVKYCHEQIHSAQFDTHTEYGAGSDIQYNAPDEAAADNEDNVHLTEDDAHNKAVEVDSIAVVVTVV